MTTQHTNTTAYPYTYEAIDENNEDYLDEAQPNNVEDYFDDNDF